METNILMESGTNELEVLEFTVGNNHYGINVAKIKEIVPFHVVTPVPNSHPNVEGIFMPRDMMITVVDLAKVINAKPSPDIKKDMFIITNFNQLNVAFHVHTVIGIHRVSWADIITPDSTVSSQDSGIATGVVKIDNQLIIIYFLHSQFLFYKPIINIIISSNHYFMNNGTYRSFSPRLTIFKVQSFGHLICMIVRSSYCIITHFLFQ